MMFDRYTDRAKRAIELTWQSARDMRQEQAGTGDLLVGLIGEGGGIAFQALTALGLTPERVGEAVRNRRPPGGGATPPVGTGFTPRLERALELAVREALLRGDNYIATEHLLLGLVREGTGTGALALADCRRHGDDEGLLAGVRAKVLELLDGGAKPAAAVKVPETTADGRRPEIVSTEAEQEILFARLCDAMAGALRRAVRPGVTVGGDADEIAAAAVTEVLRSLRVMSARQVAVLLAQEANRGSVYVIHEPPRYTADEAGG